MVEHVKKLRAKHQTRILVYPSHFSGLLQSRIEVELAWAKNNTQSAISETCSVANHRCRTECGLVEITQATG